VQAINYQALGTQWGGMSKPQSAALQGALAAFGPKLKTLLKLRGLSESELGRQMKRRGTPVSTKTINNVANGKHPPELGNLAAIADFFGVPLWVMLIPDLPLDMVSGEPLDRLNQMIKDYVACSPDDRKHAENIAAAYSKRSVK
jgi:transcriptional regulator with XRE-family HTH domain